VPFAEHLAWPFAEWFAFQCHRDPTRSALLGTFPLAVCARCFGIYLGLGAGALILKPKLTAWPLRIWVASAALLMLLDVATERLGWRPAWDALRALTGVLLAYPVGAAIVSAVRDG
jgi:uncharacterized membrane protein